MKKPNEFDQFSINTYAAGYTRCLMDLGEEILEEDPSLMVELKPYMIKLANNLEIELKKKKK